jgi:anthranilate phosphoribosyltransferase
MSKAADLTTLPPEQAMRAMIGRIATGPELSKPLSEAEARYGMRCILQPEADPVQSAIFLIALRMKRETPAENRGVLAAIRDAIDTQAVDVDDLVDLADPYNGFARTLPAAPFLPCVLSACGVPTLSHGVERLGPKFGATHHQVLAAAGINVNLSVQAAAAQIESGAGWAYLDQAVFCPPLADLTSLRERIVKRPVLTTVEVLARPLIARGRSHLLTGYVHKPYPPVYTMLARSVGYDSALLMRGTEGGVVPSLRQQGKAVRYWQSDVDEELDLVPDTFGIALEQRAPAIPEDVLATDREAEFLDGPDFSVAALASAAALRGLSALGGEAGPVRESLVYAGAVTLMHMNPELSCASAAAQVRQVLDNGKALRCFEEAAA